VAILLSRPQLDVAGMVLSPAAVVVLATSIFYLKLDVALGIVMSLLLAASLALGYTVAAQSGEVWLGSGIGLFVLGWIIQFIGHYFEGKKPAFVDDLIGLAIGPLFVVAEVAFMLGLRGELNQAIEQRAGCVRG